MYKKELPLVLLVVLCLFGLLWPWPGDDRCPVPGMSGFFGCVESAQATP